MRFQKPSDPGVVADFLANKITEKLAQKRPVAWFLTGGSTAAIAVDTAALLKSLDLSNLTVSLIDERYGPPGHQDSNWALLEKLGLALPGASSKPVLTGESFERTVVSYSGLLDKLLGEDYYRLALMGIGPDSHIAGIKPNSPAVFSTELAAGYDWDDFKGRITMTFEAIKRLDCSVSYLAKETKRDAIESLQKDLPLNKYPSQILKQVKEAIIFNDMVGN